MNWNVDSCGFWWSSNLALKAWWILRGSLVYTPQWKTKHPVPVSVKEESSSSSRVDVLTSRQLSRAGNSSAAFPGAFIFRLLWDKVLSVHSGVRSSPHQLILPGNTQVVKVQIWSSFFFLKSLQYGGKQIKFLGLGYNFFYGLASPFIKPRSMLEPYY